MPVLLDTGATLSAALAAAPVPEDEPLRPPKWYSERLEGDGDQLGPLDGSGDPCRRPGAWAFDLGLPQEVSDRRAPDPAGGPMLKDGTVPLLPVPSTDFCEGGDWTLGCELDPAFGCGLWALPGGGREVAWLLPVTVATHEEGRRNKDPERATYLSWARMECAFVARSLDADGNVGAQHVIAPAAMAPDGQAALDWVAGHAPALRRERAVAAWKAHVGSFSLHRHVSHAAWRYRHRFRPWASAWLSSRPGDKALRAWLRRLEQLPVRLEDSLWLWGELGRRVGPGRRAGLARENLPLYLAMRMEALQRAQAASCPALPPEAHPLPARPWPWSAEQAGAIRAQGPCTLVTAGAGTGKSTTVMGRVEWLTSAGVPAGDVYVLSFTNAAADHVRSMAPGLRSTTVAAVTHGIYRANHPAQRLSDDPGTLVNALRWRFKGDPVAEELADCLEAADKNERGGPVTRLRNLVHSRHDEVMALLDSLRFTTLLLEAVVCDCRLEQMQVPDEYRARHYIVDESQDDSVLDLCLTLHLAALCGATLYAVGDAAQCLYGFRGADPESLCALEGSGLFEPRRLTVNRRSAQAVLDVANVPLSQVRANRYARIQLASDELAPPTLADAEARIRVFHVPHAKPEERAGKLRECLEGGLADWLREAASQGTVAVLAKDHRTLDLLEAVLPGVLPGLKVERLCRKRQRKSKLLSSWPFNGLAEDVAEARGAADPAWALVGLMERRLAGARPAPKRKRRPKPPDPRDMAPVRTWAAVWGPEVAEAFARERAGALDAEGLVGAVAATLIDAECSWNDTCSQVERQLAHEAAERLESDPPDVALATIHKVKGLEFDSVCLVVPPHAATVQSELREAYVGLTRARSAEALVAWETSAASEAASVAEGWVAAARARALPPAAPEVPTAA